MKNISIIAVVATGNGAIGKDNQLLAHVPGDLPRLKKLTLNHTVIVGRKTLESFPGCKPLPNRTFIVLTRNKNYTCEGVMVAHSVEEVISLLEDGEETFCMGGGEIYKLFLPYTNKKYITRIEKSFRDADTFFPKCDSSKWTVKGELDTTKSKCDFNFGFMEYTRINKVSI